MAQSTASFQSVSRRAQALIKPPLGYTAAVIKSITDQFNEITNKDGAILMAIAENKLCNKTMIEKMLSLNSFSAEVLNYTMPTGQFTFRDVVATFLQQFLYSGYNVDLKHLVVTPGCCGALIQLSLLLFEAGDSVLIPAPFYPAFVADFLNFGNVHTVDVIGENADDTNIFGHLTHDALNKAYNVGLAAGHPPKAVLLCNPSNPMGTVMTVGEVRTLIDWCKERKMHLIVDEVYALSLFYADSNGDASASSAPFSSVVSLLENQLGDFVHVLWSISKDLGCSGVRVGVLYSQNETLLQAMCATNDAMQVSNITQETVAHVLRDRTFMDAFLLENRQALYNSYSILRDGLQAIGVRVVPADAGIFAFCDFRVFFPPASSITSADENNDVTSKSHKYKQERELFNALCARGVVLTPGESCHCPLPGFFRVCYAYVSVTALKEGIRRITSYYEELHSQGSVSAV